MMDDLPDRDAELIDFLRQHKSIAPPATVDLEDSLMSKIALPPTKNSGINRSWWRYLIGGIGMMAIGIVGVEIHQVMNPPAPSVAQLQQLNLYLEAHTQSLVASETGSEERDVAEDLDTGSLDRDLGLESIDYRL